MSEFEVEKWPGSGWRNNRANVTVIGKRRCYCCSFFSCVLVKLNLTLCNMREHIAEFAAPAKCKADAPVCGWARLRLACEMKNFRILRPLKRLGSFLLSTFRLQFVFAALSGAANIMLHMCYEMCKKMFIVLTGGECSELASAMLWLWVVVVCGTWKIGKLLIREHGEFHVIVQRHQQHSPPD